MVSYNVGEQGIEPNYVFIPDVVYPLLMLSIGYKIKISLESNFPMYALLNTLAYFVEKQ